MSPRPISMLLLSGFAICATLGLLGAFLEGAFGAKSSTTFMEVIGTVCAICQAGFILCVVFFLQKGESSFTG